MVRVAVPELRHVNQTFDAAEIDERPEVAERGHGPAHDRANAEALPGDRRLRRRLFFEQPPARHDDVPPAALELDDAEAQALADVRRRIVAPEIDLRGR